MSMCVLYVSVSAVYSIQLCVYVRKNAPKSMDWRWTDHCQILTTSVASVFSCKECEIAVIVLYVNEVSRN